MDTFTWNSFLKKSGVAGMQETQGERIVRALFRVYNRLQTLEEERRTAKNHVDNLDGHVDPNVAGKFHRTMAMAEARCDLLEEQLRSLREFLHQSMLPVGVPHQHSNHFPTTNQKNVVDSTSRKKSSSSSSANNHVIPGESLNNLHRLSSLASSSGVEHRVASNTHRRRRPSHRSQKNDSGSSSSRATTLSHYHINMSDMPFVSATSTSKSHSLRANIQNLHSLVNSHNPNIRPNLRRGRSSSVDRQQCSRSKRIHGQRGIPRWHSLSDVSKTSTESTGQRRSRGGFHAPSDIMADLDTIPVRLENNSQQPIVQDDACDHPGKVCIRTELRNQPKGCSKTFEVKMTTSTGGPTRSRGKADLQNLQNKRHLLRDLRNLQYALREDQ